MPLYTFVMTFKGTTKVAQYRRSNYTGFVLTPIAEAFPHLEPAFGDLMRMRPAPVPNTQRVWTCATNMSGEAFTLHVVETRG